jgi:hypothetical protein
MDQKRRDVADVIREYYSVGGENERLSQEEWQVERVRTESILKRFLPQPPAIIVDKAHFHQPVMAVGQK